ncbi:MAG: PIN-like domain-containing protein [Bacteroidota bacterium]
MKNSINDNEISNIWEKGVFVFDSSTLLNLYEFTDEMLAQIFNSSFSRLKNKIWIPHHVQLEIAKNVYKPKKQKIEKYDDLLKKIKSIEGQFEQIDNKTKTKDKHPTLDRNDIDLFLPELQKFSRNLKEKIELKIKEINEPTEEDVISKFIKENFQSLSGFNYSQKIELIKDAELRFRNSIPPGYKDDDKPGFQKYADLIIWKETLELIKDKKCPLIFIVDDLKEDWWILDKKNNPVSPRVELIEEVFFYSGETFLMYNLPEFLKQSNIIFETKVDKEAIDKASEIISQSLNSIPENILITANRSEEEKWRLDRLKELAIYISGFLDLKDCKITGLHDHKGDLTVTWSSKPTESEKLIIAAGWENQNELSMNITHYIEEN